MITWHGKERRVSHYLLQLLAAYEPRQHHTRLRSFLFQTARVGIFYIGIPGYYELVVSLIKQLPCRYQIVETLLLNKPSQRHHITLRLQPQTFYVIIGLRHLRLIHTVEYQIGVCALIFLGQDIGNDLRNHYHLIGITCAEAFAGTQHQLCHRTPFLAVVIRPVVGVYNPQPHKPRKRGQQSRTYGVDMHHIGLQPLCHTNGTPCMHYCFKAFAVRCLDNGQFHTPVFFGMTGSYVGRPAYHRDVMSQRRKTRI